MSCRIQNLEQIAFKVKESINSLNRDIDLIMFYCHIYAFQREQYNV